MPDPNSRCATSQSSVETSAFADVAPVSRRRGCLVVVDGFYRDPVAARRQALELEYREHGRGRDGYTGLIAELPGALGVTPMPAIAQALGLPLEFEPARQGTIRCITAGHYAEKVDAYPDGARHLGWLHYDGFDWTGVLALCPPELVRGTTTFWRHIGFELDGFHDTRRVGEILRETGFGIEELVARIDSDFTDPDCWREVGRVAHAFNRLILFRGEMFHVSSEGFGSTPQDCKMTQNFFVDEAHDAAAVQRAGYVRVVP